MPEVLTRPKTADPKQSSWSMWEKLIPSRQIQEEQWHLNMAFLIGRHYAVYDRATKRLIDAIRNDLGRVSTGQTKRTRVVSNHVLRLFRQKLSDFLKMKPAVMIQAVSEEPSDLKAAETSQNITLYLQHKHKFQNLMRQFWTVNMLFGQVSLYPCWNKSKSPLGEEELILLTPFETYWTMGRWPDPSQEVYVVQAMGLDEISERFGKDVAEEREVFASPIEQQIRFLLEQREETEEGKEMARVLTHFKLPCKAYPQGLYRVETVGGNELHTGTMFDMPWYFDDEQQAHLPVVKFNFYEIPLTRYGMSYVEPIISPQRE